jgi:uncharacterized cofD-like protein
MVATELVEARVVALGGGHGLHASLSALRRVVTDLTAVVTVADNGGSSGRLREEFGVLPPGDLRMALAALCGDDDWGRTWERVIQHRFTGIGELRGHSVGNLLIVGLWELFRDSVEGLHWVGELLGAEGRVLPMALTPMDIQAEVSGADPADPTARRTVRGQVEVATAGGRIESISLSPSAPVACPEAVGAVADADWIVLGPGSWFSSVIPHLLVPDLRKALVTSSARIVVTLNVTAQDHETPDYAPADYLTALWEHAPELGVDTVLVDPSVVTDRPGLDAAVSAHGSTLVVAKVCHEDGTPRHDPVRLAAAYRHILTGQTPSNAPAAVEEV